MAKLYFRYSAMNSGKTTALLQVAHNYEERGMKVLILKPAIDTKGGTKLLTRIGLERDADVLVHVNKTIDAIVTDHPDVNCILVDEAQFLTPSQAEELFWLASNGDIPVITYGLRTDFQTKGFPGASRLLELAHDLQELKTICRCGKKALLNARKVNGQFTHQGNQVAIDGEDTVEYESKCPRCYAQEVRTV